MKLSAQDIVTGSDIIAIEGEIVLTTLPLKGQQARSIEGAAKQIKMTATRLCIPKAGRQQARQAKVSIVCGGRLASVKDKTDGVYVRNPSFTIRVAQYEGSLPVDEYVAALGASIC